MARETSTAPLLLFLALTFQSPAMAQTGEADCPQPRTAEVDPPKPAADDPATPVTIEADDNDFTFDVNGNAVLSGNVVMRQGDKVIRADRLEYNAKSGQAKLTGAVEFYESRAQGARQQRRLFPGARRAIRRHAVRAAAAQCARLGAQHAGGRQRHGDAGRCVVHHLPGHGGRLAAEFPQPRDRLAQTRKARGAAPASSSRTCPSSICPG